ncbi:MAG: SAVED domain-containing protein [Candidatus Caldatribacteriota bacterium]
MPKLSREIEKYFNGKGDLDLIFRMIDNGHIDQEDVPFCYELIAANACDQTTFILIGLLRIINKEWHDYALLAKTLNCLEETAYELINNKGITVRIPVVDPHGDRCQISELLVIPLSKENLFTNQAQEDNLQLISKLTNKKYYIAIQQDICDSSYMLALYTALVADDDKYLDEYVYSGRIRANGQVESPTELDMKQKCSTKAKYRLVYGDFTINEFNYWITNNKIPVPFVVLFDRAAAEGIESIKKNILGVVKKQYEYFSFELLERFYDLQMEDLFLLEQKPLPLKGSIWSDFILNQALPILVEALRNVPSNKRIFQVFGSNAVLLFGIGTILSEYYAFQGYHFYNGEYYLVITNGEDIRGMKKRLKPKELTLTECKIEDQKEVMLVNIYLASHRPDFASREFLSKQGIEYGTADIELKIDQGNIDFNQSWLPYVNELYNHLNLIFERSKQVHLFMSCPVTIAFALGVAVGHYWDITAYQYDLKNKTYFKAFNLNDI